MKKFYEKPETREIVFVIESEILTGSVLSDGSGDPEEEWGTE